MSAKRQLFLWHRYLGITLCLFLVMWFASGMVLMYVHYPSLSGEHRLAGLPALPSGQDLLAPSQVVDDHAAIDALRLTSVTGKPTYHVLRDDTWQNIDAVTGVRTAPDNQALRKAAERHGDAPVASLQQVRVDQWTVTSDYDPHRPLVRAVMDDEAGTYLYLSSRTGEVVQAATHHERTWNWVGAVLHWIYPWQLRQYPSLWSNVVIILCIPALALIITGTIVGLQRLRLRRRYKHNRVTPYRGIQRWHHLLGITCTVFVTSFMFSGLMSMNPGGIFSYPSPGASMAARWADGPLIPDATASPSDLLTAGSDVREIVWQRHAGTPLALVRGPSGRSVHTAAGARPDLGRDELVKRADAVIDDGKPVDVTRLTRHSHYYYDRHDPPPLPVLRIRMDDPAATTLYINPDDARIEARFERSTRWRRWLYNGLHSLDFPFLWGNRPLWDVVMLTLCTLGLLFSLTGVVIGWRRLSMGGGRSRRGRRA